MNYADKTPREIVEDFVKVRGDLIEESGRASLIIALRRHFMAPILKLHREVDDLGIGVRTCAQHCRDLQTGAIYPFPCPTFSEASAYMPS